LTGSSYRLQTTDTWPGFERRWATLAEATRVSPFQRIEWLRQWYQSFARPGSVDPLLISISDAVSGEDVMLLPLIVRRRAGLSTVEFADLGVTDINAPLLGRGAPSDAAGAQAIWQLLVDNLSGHDAIRFQKMPKLIGERPNPLAFGSRVRVADLRRWILTADDRWVVERKRGRAYKRSQNGFAKAGRSRFIFAKTEGEAQRILLTLERLQLARLSELGRSHILAEPEHRSFYEALGASGGTDFTYLSALELDGELVACLLSVASKPWVTFLRVASDSRFAHLSLGRHLMELTMMALRENGYEMLDLSIGDAGHKARLGASPQPVYELSCPLSWQGSLFLGALGARRLIGQLRRGYADKSAT
jgi:CelD/BcsL family acetyltransferase involved in cellulose biosynthesis